MLKKGTMEISERLDDRSTLSPTEMGFNIKPKYNPVKISNVEAKTIIDLKIKPLG